MSRKYWLGENYSEHLVNLMEAVKGLVSNPAPGKSRYGNPFTQVQPKGFELKRSEKGFGTPKERMAKSKDKAQRDPRK